MNISLFNTLRNIPIRSQELATMLGQMELGRQYKSPSAKLTLLEQKGEIIRLKRGLYVLNGAAYGYPPSAQIVSNHLYGPSYLSMQWALSYYGLIPERTYTYTAITIKHARQFDNALGHFTYRQVSPTYYPIGITTQTADGAAFRIATPEKALCDTLLSDSYLPYDSQKGVLRYLEEDLRLDIDALRQFDTSVVAACAQQRQKQIILNNLVKIIQQL